MFVSHSESVEVSLCPLFIQPGRSCPYKVASVQTMAAAVSHILLWSFRLSGSEECVCIYIGQLQCFNS